MRQLNVGAGAWADRLAEGRRAAAGRAGQERKSSLPVRGRGDHTLELSLFSARFFVAEALECHLR